MAAGAVTDFEADFVDVVRTTVEQFSRIVHFIVKQETVNGVAINLLETHLEFLEVEANLVCEFLQSGRFGHVCDDDFFGAADFHYVVFIYQERALLGIGIF